MQPDGLRLEIDRVDVVENELGLEALGMLLETRHELGTLHAHRVGGPVVDIGGRHQLATLRKPGDQHGLEIGARGVYCRRVSGGPGSQDQQAGVLGEHAILASQIVQVYLMWGRRPAPQPSPIREVPATVDPSNPAYNVSREGACLNTCF